MSVPFLLRNFLSHCLIYRYLFAGGRLQRNEELEDSVLESGVGAQHERQISWYNKHGIGYFVRIRIRILVLMSVRIRIRIWLRSLTGPEQILIRIRPKCLKLSQNQSFFGVKMLGLGMKLCSQLILKSVF